MPRLDPYYDRVGVASWYGHDFHGRRTANGEIYNMDALTAAHPTLPIPSYVSVTNMANGRTLMVRVNDRGPFVGDRIIDLSRATARLLDLERPGTGRVRVRYLGRAPLDGDDRREHLFLAAQPWYRWAVADGPSPDLVSPPRLLRSGVDIGFPRSAGATHYGLGGWSVEAYRRAR